jgi:putative Mg2+ transporter-C (MgtC) family protein
MEAFATIDIVIKILVAIGLGTIIGLERTLAGKIAGMRTYAMVSLGSSLFVLISENILSGFSNPSLANPLLIISAVITGIGFIGAGLMISQNDKIIGLTTAAGLWVSAGVGIACGLGLFTLATIVTIATLFVFTFEKFLEDFVKKYSYKTGDGQK